MEPLRREMLPVLHRRHDDSEGFELEALLAEDGVGSKERDDLRQKIVAVPYHVDERSVPTSSLGVGPDPAAAESGSQELEDRGSLRVLADVELGDELPAEPCGRVPLDRDVEASFPVDVSREVVVQPFLLIVRRGHLDHPPVGLSPLLSSRTLLLGCDNGGTAGCIRSFQHLAEFTDSAIFTVSRRSKPSSRTALMGEQPNPWDLLRPQDAMSRHRGAKQCRRYGLLGTISLLSPGYLLAVERQRFHMPLPDH
jgi:hypothetical protein